MINIMHSNETKVYLLNANYACRENIEAWWDMAELRHRNI